MLAYLLKNDFYQFVKKNKVDSFHLKLCFEYYKKNTPLTIQLIKLFAGMMP